MLERGFTRTLAALVMIALPAITWAAGSGESSGPGSLVVPLGMMLLGATVLAILLSYVKQSSLLAFIGVGACLLYTSPSPRDVEESRMPSSA